MIDREAQKSQIVVSIIFYSVVVNDWKNVVVMNGWKDNLIQQTYYASNQQRNCIWTIPDTISSLISVLVRRTDM